MPQVRKLNNEEVRAIERKTLGTRKATEIEYDRYLAGFVPGEYGEVALHAGENRLTVRNRLKMAAGRHDPPLALTFQRTRGDVLRFSVDAGEAVPSAATTAAPKSRGGPGGRQSAPAAEPARRRRRPDEA